MNKKQYYKLDGKDNGFALWIYEEERFVQNTYNKTLLFKSLDLAKVYIANQCNILNPYNYKVLIILSDRGEIDFNNVYGDEDTDIYYYYDNDELIAIEPDCNEQVLSLGYYVFEEGDTIQTQKEYGKRRQKELFRYINESFADIMKYSSKIAKINRDRNNHLCISIANSTSKIHVCFNSQIMTLNQERKELGIRCLPYEKEIDKYTTIYTYITRDFSEPKSFNSDKVAKEVFYNSITFINDKHPEALCRYRNVKFNGIITMEEK